MSTVHGRLWNGNLNILTSIVPFGSPVQGGPLIQPVLRIDIYYASLKFGQK